MKRFRFLIPVLFTLCLILVFYFKRFIVIKYYPPIMNLFIFLVFFCSLFSKETIIQRIARQVEGKLTEKTAIYTRNLTYIWCIFMFINFVISVITIFLSDEIWMIYNGFISYMLVGLLFAVEYIIRIIFRKRNYL